MNCDAMPEKSVQRFLEGEAKAGGEPAVQGFLHLPEHGNGDAAVLTHGAGGNCDAELLMAVAEALAREGIAVLRCDLPFRHMRRHGPPFSGGAARDRDGLRRAIAALRKRTSGRMFVGGHSYGGRQASMLLAEEPRLAAGLLLLSYPLHPPKKPAELRVKHFPQIVTPTFFAHGERDPFG